jgi:hypothetical protein
MVADNSIGRTWSCFGTRLSSKLLYSGVRIVWLGAAILVASFELALSEQFSGTPAEACLAVNRYLSLGAQLPRTAARLKSGERLLIVAIGSSSTVGLWVLRSAATYPEVMRPLSRDELRLGGAQFESRVPGTLRVRRFS